VGRALRTLLRSLLGGADSPPRVPESTPAGRDPAAADPYAARRARQQDIEKSVQVEIHKALITNTLDYIKTTAQVLSGVTGVLLSTYIALLVGFRRDTGLSGAGEWLLALIPVTCWLASIASAFMMAVASPRYDLVVLDLRAAMDTYGQVLRSRRRQLIVPSLLTLTGLIALALLFNPVFVSPRRPPATTGASGITTSPPPGGADTAPSDARPTPSDPSAPPERSK
jgi:hypothetical protein